MWLLIIYHNVGRVEAIPYEDSHEARREYLYVTHHLGKEAELTVIHESTVNADHNKET